MGIPAGPWYIDDLLTFTVNTHDVATGAAADAGSVPTYRVYENETGTAILTGSMAKLDDANTIGFYSEQLTLSAANGFEVGKSYSIYVAATVNSVAATQSFNFKVIAAPIASLDAAGIRAALGMASANLDTQLATIESQTDDIGVAGAGLTAIPWNPAWDAEVQSEVTDALNAYDSPTKAELDAAVAPLALEASLATVAGYLDTEIAAILEDTGTTIPAQIAALNNLSAADVNAEVDQALADYDAPTKAELDAAVATLATAADLATVDGNVDAIKAKTDGLTFTVTGQVDANVESVNGTEVTGSGTEGDPWGP